MSLNQGASTWAVISTRRSATTLRGRSVFEQATTLILEIHGGEGGKDSKLFAADLLDAYRKYAAKSGLASEVLDESDGHAMLKISGRGCWPAFKREPGKHVVQRVPPTERNGRRQTSIVTVAALPLPPEHTQEPLREKDLETIVQTGKQGAGGQNVNKVASAVRMKHKPTGLAVFINGRDQGKNKAEALRILTYRVNEQKRARVENAYSQGRKDQMMAGSDRLGGRGDKVRNYNFIRGEIVDNNLCRSTKDVKSFMKGDFRVLFGE